ncbi:hypothetical protein ATN88_20435 [Enterovibrio coralii]|uniref:Uncharacterized protein n=1 Tax=Enterovibrio coralii TaxID=294935 RepID=A0A135I8T2_9GAMM|nr:hypothetical protein ATN88_20435 [Enterovibrio coralii]
MQYFLQWLFVTKRNYFNVYFWSFLFLFLFFVSHWIFYVPPTLVTYVYDRFPAEDIYCAQKGGNRKRTYLYFKSAYSKESFRLSPHSLEMCEYLIDRMLEGSSVEVTYSTIDIDEVTWVSKLKVDDQTYFDDMRKFNLCDYLPARKCIPKED